MKLAKSQDTTGDGEADSVGVSRAAITLVIQKYHRYLREQAVVDKIFDTYDTNKSGELERPQLLALLEQYVQSMGTKPTDEDVDFVLEARRSRARVARGCVPLL